MPHLKVCGLKFPVNIREVLGTKPDFIGFIFYAPSKRFVEHLLDPLWVKNLSGSKKVGVFVNATKEYIQETAEAYGLDYIQLHGQESPSFCQKLKTLERPLIKAFAVDKAFDFSVLEPYNGIVDYFLFDTKGALPGGNGYGFDWDILQQYQLQTPFFLSGGIGPENIQEAMQWDHPQLFAVDVNSRFESEPGRKIIGQIEQIRK